MGSPKAPQSTGCCFKQGSQGGHGPPLVDSGLGSWDWPQEGGGRTRAVLEGSGPTASPTRAEPLQGQVLPF